MKLLSVKEKVGFIALLLFILTAAITVTINATFLYHFDVNYLAISDQVGLSKETILTNYQQLMTYLNNPFISLLEMKDFPVSESGAFHFYEVKRLFLLNYLVCAVSLIPAFIFLRHLFKSKRLWLIRNALGFTAMVPVIIGFFMLIAFEKVFVFFHHVMFNNDAWLFDPVTDPVIMILPESYFFHCFILAILLFECSLLVLMWLGKRQLKSEDL